MFTPLYVAAQHNHRDCVMLLFNLEIEAKNNIQLGSMLVMMSKCGYLEIVMILIEQHDVDVNTKDAAVCFCGGGDELYN